MYDLFALEIFHVPGTCTICTCTFIIVHRGLYAELSAGSFFLLARLRVVCFALRAVIHRRLTSCPLLRVRRFYWLQIFRIKASKFVALKLVMTPHLSRSLIRTTRPSLIGRSDYYTNNCRNWSEEKCRIFTHDESRAGLNVIREIHFFRFSVFPRKQITFLRNSMFFRRLFTAFSNNVAVERTN